MWPTWGLSGSDRTQVGPMLAPWSLLSGMLCWMIFQFVLWSSWSSLCMSRGSDIHYSIMTLASIKACTPIMIHVSIACWLERLPFYETFNYWSHICETKHGHHFRKIQVSVIPALTTVPLYRPYCHGQQNCLGTWFPVSGYLDEIWLNPLHAKFFRGNKSIYLHFMSFLHIDMIHAIKILPHQVRHELTYSTQLVSWVLMEQGARASATMVLTMLN